MRETNSKDLHGLAHRYYLGELSYESYRKERTQLLDSLTQHAGVKYTNTDNTRPIPDKASLVQASSSRWQRPIWILMIILIMIVAVIFAMKSGWIAISPAQMEHEATATSVTEPDINRQ